MLGAVRIHEIRIKHRIAIPLPGPTEMGHMQRGSGFPPRAVSAWWISVYPSVPFLHTVVHPWFLAPQKMPCIHREAGQT